MIALSTEQDLALAFDRARFRHAHSYLLQFDRSLARAVQQGGPPVAGQIRLAWWREQIDDLQAGRGSNPILAGLSIALPDKEAAQEHLTRIVDAWEMLLVDDALNDESLLWYAKGRGGNLFRLAANLTPSSDHHDAEAAGILWALVDLARHCSGPAVANRAFGLARAYLGSARQLPRHLRSFALLAYFAERDVVRGSDRLLPAGSPRRLVQAWKFSLGLG
ncbi:squalene/phytoene synthase family protein [Aquisediminimonas profunda]|uniref:squalene/phytoene synthase family protein n=1 Tax=Aquisediminimonas profunda TaxID=1550733 RepID=UPI001C6344DB|nr:squalene/phytoene synthase family protein [Aquisediminimonas profunda]